VLWARTVSLPRIAATLPGGVTDPGRERRFRRWLSKVAVDPHAIWQAMLPTLLAHLVAQPKVILVFGPTPLDTRAWGRGTLSGQGLASSRPHDLVGCGRRRALDRDLGPTRWPSPRPRYRRRVRCEATYEDGKSRIFHLEATKLSAWERIDRLLLVLHLPSWWAMRLGQTTIRHGERHRKDRRDWRKLSVVRLGLRCLNAAERDDRRIMLVFAYRHGHRFVPGFF
jgi:hypothetical protein